MWKIFYFFVAVFVSVTVWHIGHDMYHGFRRRRAYGGLTDEQFELLTTLEAEYEKRVTLHDQAVSNEASALVIGQVYDKEELWAPYHVSDQKVSDLEGRCLQAGIEEWRVSDKVILKLKKVSME